METPGKVPGLGNGGPWEVPWGEPPGRSRGDGEIQALRGDPGTAQGRGEMEAPGRSRGSLGMDLRGDLRRNKGPGGEELAS